MAKPKRRCNECKKTSFHKVNQQYVCIECNTYATDNVEYDESPGPIQSKRAAAEEKKMKKEEEWERKNKLIQSWDLYDGFNYILVKMTDALIKCGADPEIKPTVHKLWASYLSKMEIAFYDDDNPEAAENAEPATEVEEEPSIIPSWFSQNPEQDSLDESDDTLSQDREPIKKTKLFAPKAKCVKKRFRRVRKRNGVTKLLVETADEDLTPMDKRKKNQIIRSNFMKRAIRGAESEVPMAESITSSAESETETQFCSRLHTMKYIVPECFPEGELISKLKRIKKTEEYVAPITTTYNPEYMTLHKLLSFLHAALLMRGQLISFSDLKRWIREGFIPFYGAHQLFPATMPITGCDSIILGAAKAVANGAPCSRIFLMNTARVLTMLGYGTVPNPPTYVVASKIIVDLQLPNELEIYVRTMDKIINKGVDGFDDKSWRHVKFSDKVPSENVYAGALVLASMKLIFGLDGATEYKISDFAEQVNNLLKLKPSSGFARKKQGSENVRHQPSFMDVRTLFVWKEWVRFIEYRRNAINRNHVPTAIRKKLVKKMDPEYVLRFAQNEGYYHFKHPSADKFSDLDKSVLEILEKAKAKCPSPPGPTKKIPTFRPSIFGMQGLADQLLKFDSLEYGLLKQEFSTSSLVFSWKSKRLATALNKAKPPHRLNVNKGSARKEIKLTMPFVNSRSQQTPTTMKMERYAWKIITVESNIISVSPDDEEVEDESKPILLLYNPASTYWIASIGIKNAAYVEWKLFTAGLPPTFLWMLNLICESIEESPRDFYEVFTHVETIVFLHHAKVTRSLSNKVQIKKRIFNSLTKQF